MTKLEKKLKKLFFKFAPNCVMANDFFNHVVEIEADNLEMIDRKGKLKELAKDMARCYKKAMEERSKRFDEMPDTPTMGDGIYVVEGRDGNQHALVPLADFSVLWDYDDMWGSKLFQDYDFSKDPNQNSVKATFVFSELDEELANEVMWMTLRSSWLDESGERYYYAVLDNDPAGLDIEAMCPEAICEETGGLRLMVPAKALQCVFDNEAFKKQDQSNMYRKEPTIPVPATVH